MNSLENNQKILTEESFSTIDSTSRFAVIATPPRRPRGRPKGVRNAKPVRTGNKIVMTVLGDGGLDWILQCAPVYAGVLHGIESAITDNGYRMIVNQAADRTRLASILQTNTAAGLIVIGFDTGTANQAGISVPSQAIPAIWAMGSPLNFQGDHVQPDHLRIGVIGAKHLLERGHRNCALFGCKMGNPASLMHLRNDGFCWTIREAGGTVLPLLYSDLIKREPHGHIVDKSILDAAIQKLLGTNPRPTAIFLESDLLAPHAYERLIAAGVQPQRDIEIVTCNNEQPYLAALKPKPTVVDIQSQIIGRRAVDQLLWRIQNPAAPFVRLMIDPVLVRHAPGSEGNAPDENHPDTLLDSAAHLS